MTALEQYHVLAAEDDGAILPDTEEPVEAGDHYVGSPALNPAARANRRFTAQRCLQRRRMCTKVHWWSRSSGFSAATV